MGNHGIICYLAVVKFPVLLRIDLVGMYSNEVLGHLVCPSHSPTLERVCQG